VRFSYVLFIALIIAMACYSCSDRGGKNIDQGEIHYNIDYIGSVGGMPRDILPKALIVSFKKDKILFEMSTPIGNSGVINLANPDKGIYDTYLSLFTLRLLYEAQPGEIFPGFESMDSMILTKTTKTTVICGYNCKNAEVTFPSIKGRVFDIWYTDEIDIKNPNEATPFNSIDGVLLNFFFLMGKTELHFDAETVYRKDIPDALFERRDKFMRVSKENISKFIRKMINM
jgi:hypothetical protein